MREGSMRGTLGIGRRQCRSKPPASTRLAAAGQTAGLAGFPPRLAAAGETSTSASSSCWSKSPATARHQQLFLRLGRRRQERRRQERRRQERRRQEVCRLQDLVLVILYIRTLIEVTD